MITTLSESRPVARKPHRCDACLGTIGVGDRYVRQSNVDGADMWTWKAHTLCESIVWRMYRDAGLFGDDEMYPDPYEVREELAAALAVVGARRWMEEQ